MMNAAEILELRKKLNLSQTEFAKKIYVSQETVSQFETGARWPNKGTQAHLESLAKGMDL